VFVVVLSLSAVGVDAAQSAPTVTTPPASGSGTLDLDRRKDSVKSYEELTRLLVALATGTLVLAPTVLGAIKGSNVVRRAAFSSAVVLLVTSMALGIFTLSALTGTQFEGNYDISLGLIRWPAVLQWLTFGLGLLMFCVFVLGNLSAGQESGTDAYLAAIRAYEELARMKQRAGDTAAAEFHYREVIRLRGESRS
jgi:hypothetical protein